MAKDAGIKLREDELVHQFSGLVDLLLDASDPDVAAGKRKMSIMAFSGKTEKLISPSKSANAVKAVLNDFAKADRFETEYAKAFSKFKTFVGTQGNDTEANPDKMLILITDGIESRDAFHSQKAIDVGLCTDLKASGIKLAVIELKYPKLTSNFLYDDTVLPVEDDISPAMEACASPGWYFQAADNADIPVKFNEIKNKFGVAFTRLME